MRARRSCISGDLRRMAAYSLQHTEIQAPPKPLETPQKSAAGGRVFKISLKRVPPVKAKMWAQMKAAAFMPSEGRSYPEINEVPDASI